MVRIIVFLIAGAIVNVAVAWGCAFICVPPDCTIQQMSHQHSFDLLQDRFPDFPIGRVNDVGGNLLQWIGRTAVVVGWTADPEQRKRRISNFGLPLRSLKSEITSTKDARSQSGVVWTLGPPHMLVQFAAIPIWPGFAINTLFYAVIFWLLFAAPFALRRRSRVKRGLCPACAYPRGASEVCTECGTQLD